VRRLVLACLLVTSGAYADDEPAPKPTRVQARLDGPTAIVSVRYELRFTRQFPAAQVTLPLPSSGVITGASVTIEGGAHRLALVPASVATDAIETIRAGKGSVPGWAVLVSQDAYRPQVEIIAPRAGRATLDLEIAAPTCFYSDTRYLGVPASWSRDTGNRDIEAACGAGPWLRFGGYELSRKPAGDARIVTRVDRLHVTGGDFAHLEVDLARELSEVPRDLHTAFVIDGSRSLDDGDRAAQAALVASYLEHAPHTFVQVIELARTAHALLPGWDGSDVGAPRIDHLLRTIRPHNGSNLEAGLAEAGAWLARTGGTRRVVVITDDRLADRLTAMEPATLARLLPAGTLAHVVVLSSGALERDDDTALARLPAATGGMLVRGGIDDKGHADALELVRPIAIDHVEVQATGWMPIEGAASTCKAELGEGLSCSWWGKGDVKSDAVVVEGYLWGQHLHRVLHPDPARARAVARELSVMSVLDDAVRTEVDHAAFAVNSAWSLLATWGGNGGYSDEESYGGMIGNECGCDLPSDVGYTVASGDEPPVADLEPQLQSAIAACHPGGTHLDIAVELTGEEIVDVTVTGATGALRTCVSEAVWNTELRIADPPYHAVTHVKL
jgi:hypothetical protein